MKNVQPLISRYFPLFILRFSVRIYTKTGDRGTTGLFGGTRVSKRSVRLHAYGTLDELNACLGIINAEKEVPLHLRDQLMWIQSLLFSVCADLATPSSSTGTIKRMNVAPASTMEGWIDEMEKSLPVLKNFILPGGSKVGALLHEARTICRRAERWIVELHEKESMNEAVIVIINRLSDYLFVAARYANKELGVSEKTIEIPRG